ncbi:thioredoxin family protein [Mycolicibacterium pyrenivorans]|uniref:thioredoxin family protein n=1 Tax=Mycolicibacterium pyrenivorans TaxID=187102 RepID=UPI0021F28B4F|nr:thioredoxin family protein [Mycolicibacterium pyrenivorans]MCV7151478.1 thioredoxin family protein [Mycolicibacterium pyrenivorans]
MGRNTSPILRAILVLLAALLVITPLAAPVVSRAAPRDEVTLYFFWGEGCPHCAAAKPVLAELDTRYPQLEVRSFEVWNSAENQRLFAGMAAKFGIEPTGVPTFFLGQKYWVGYLESMTPHQLEDAILQCLASGCQDAGAGVLTPADEAPSGISPTPEAPGPGQDVVDLPIFGEIDAGSQSLALSTLLIAIVDGFNPCSLWVLSVLLALTLRTGSRRAIAVIGLTFIFVTALVYALFIAGLFSIFSVVSSAPWIRVVVALIAAGFAAINIKDFFWFKQGVSLTIPEASKPGIYQRMRGVLALADSMPALVAATAVLAAGVSFVELACTAGFPVLWTNIVAARDVTPAVFALLLGLYMLVYQLDELVIFGVAVVTMRATKLQEKQGRLLKLVGGMLMLSLAIVMLVDPSLMNNVATSLLVFAAAGAATLLVLLIQRIVLSRLAVGVGTTDHTSDRAKR